jgi:hypothetical protein
MSRPSWSPRQQSRFAARGIAQRACLLGDSTAPDGNNVLLAGRRLRLAFTRFDQTRAMEEEGYRAQVDAIAHLPLALGLTVAIGATLTYLPTAETYRLDAIGSNPGTGLQKLILRRVNGG